MGERQACEMRAELLMPAENVVFRDNVRYGVSTAVE